MERERISFSFTKFYRKRRKEKEGQLIQEREKRKLCRVGRESEGWGGAKYNYLEVTHYENPFAFVPWKYGEFSAFTWNLLPTFLLKIFLLISNIKIKRREDKPGTQMFSKLHKTLFRAFFSSSSSNVTGEVERIIFRTQSSRKLWWKSSSHLSKMLKIRGTVDKFEKKKDIGRY